MSYTISTAVSQPKVIVGQVSSYFTKNLVCFSLYMFSVVTVGSS